MKKMLKRILTTVITVMMIIGAFPAAGIFAFAEEQVDVWDGTRVDFVTPVDDVYYIESSKQFAWFAAQVNAGNTFSGKTIELKVNIDLNNIAWTPIGKTLTCAFSGTFNGKDKTISNLNVSSSIDSASIINAPYHSVGLFGVCVNADVSRLNLKNSNISINNTSGYSNSQSSIDGTSVFAGEICGYSKNSKIYAIYSENATITATTGSEAGAVNCGGFIGLMTSGSEAAYCFKYNGSTSGTSQSLTQNAFTGGVVGRIVNEGTVRQSCNYGTVLGGHTTSSAYTGGIVGYSENSSTTLSTIKDCFNQGTISHSGSWLETGAVGGIIGYCFSSVNRCYNSGNIVASTNTVGGDLFAAGIAGNSNSNAEITNCAAFPQKITGGTKNYVISANGIRNNNISYSGISGSLNNDSTEQRGLSAFSGSALYINLGWNFSEIWEDGESDYPVLRKMISDVEQEISEVNDAIENLLIQFAEGDNYNKVTQDIQLLDSINGLAVNWESSNTSIIDPTNGKVIRPKNTTQIRLIASISKTDSYVCTKKFVLCVIGTESNENVQSEDWGMPIDAARELIAMVRGCKFKDVATDDPDVLVLIGQDTNEENIQNTMVNLIDFWEVPVDNAYLRTKVGDVIGLIKSGSDSAINELVSDLSDGLVKYDTTTDTGEINGKTVAKKLMAIPEAMFNIKINAIDAYDKIKTLGSISFNTEDDIMLQTLNNCQKVGNFVDYTVNKANSASGDTQNPSKLGKVFSCVSKVLEGVKLYGAYKDTKQNAVKAYLKNYLDNRGNYSSPEDEEFRLIMDTHVITSINTDIDNIEAVAESLYFLNSKFCSGLDDEYKIVIACPVDIEVYDNKGELVGRVVNNTVDESIYNSVKITLSGENNDQKNIYIQDKENYSIKMIGNADGNMDVCVASYTSGYQDFYSYDNIYLEKDKNMIMDISYDEINETDIPQIETLIDGAYYYASETKEVDNCNKLYNFNAFECLEKSNVIEITDVCGKVTDGLIEEGTILPELITAKFGYSFDGFYMDAECSIPYTQVKMPQNALSLYAKFIRNDKNISILEQPVGASYIADEPAESLRVSYECVDGYDSFVQWYKKDLSDTDESAEAIIVSNEDIYTPSTSECGIFGYYAVITLTDNEGNIIAQTRSNTAIINIDESNLVESGICGENLHWSFYENNKLKFYGSGNMQEFNSENDVPWKEYSEKIDKIVIPETVYSISSYAFYNCCSLKSIAIPDSVTSIGEYTFNNCDSIEFMQLPFVGNSKNANNTYDSVFGYIFGRSKTDETGTAQYYCLKDNSFSGYYYKIPQSLKRVVITNAETIPFGAFSGCSNLSDIVLNNGISKIDGYAFSGCSGLKSFVVPNSVTNILESAFADCSSIESITLPFVGSSREANNTYDAVLGYIFGRCASDEGTAQYFALNDTTLSSYYYKIPSSLKEITITDADIIPFGAFHNCSNITDFNLNDVSSIGGFSFANCTGITNLIIPDSVTTIEEKALNGCNNIVSLNIPFIGSSRTANGTYDSVLGYIFGRSSSGVVQYGIVSGTSLSGYYYAIPSSLTSVTVTDASIVPIGAFSNCTDISYIQLNEGIKELSDYSLMECTGLKEIRFPSSLQTLSYTVLYDCSNLEKAYFYSRSCQIDNYNETIPSNATIYAYSGSTAQSYANLIGRDFIPIDVAISTSTLKIDYNKKIIYGITPGMNNIMSEISISGEGNAEISSFGKAFTGIEVKLKDVTGLTTDIYKVVIFGDVNGDGWYDGTDAITVSCIANGLLTREQIGEAVWMAADCNHDGVIDQSDVDLLNQAGVLLANVDQTQSEGTLMTDSSYVEYLNLIDQQVEGTSEEAAKDNPEIPTQNTWYTFIKLIIDIIKQLISTIKLF